MVCCLSRGRVDTFLAKSLIISHGWNAVVQKDIMMNKPVLAVGCMVIKFRIFTHPQTKKKKKILIQHKLHCVMDSYFSSSF